MRAAALMLVPDDGMRAWVSGDVAALAEGRCGGSSVDLMLELLVGPSPLVGVERPVLAGVGAGVSRVRARSMVVSMEQGW